MKKLLPLLLVSVFAFIITNSCQNSDPNKVQGQDLKKADAPNEATLAEGFRLLETNCFSCHSTDATMETRVAPPMMAIKRHYVTEGKDLETFTSELIDFVSDPAPEKTRLPHAVEKFGVMPKMEFDKDQLAAIAAYIYAAEFEMPGWHKKQYAAEKKKYMKGNRQDDPLLLGKNLAMQTKAVLGKNLLAAINAHGSAGAVDFCSTRAIPITDSMALALNASIKRVSDLNRNPENYASPEELEYIKMAKEQLAAGYEVKPQILEAEGRFTGYYPIMTNQMCLQCHGKKDTDINAETQDKLNKLYPSDLATGYGPNQLRGIWVVEFDR